MNPAERLFAAALRMEDARTKMEEAYRTEPYQSPEYTARHAELADAVAALLTAAQTFKKGVV